MKKNLRIILLFVILFAAFKLGEKTAYLMPDIWWNLIGPALFVWSATVIVLKLNKPYEEISKDNKTSPENSLKPE